MSRSVVRYVIGKVLIIESALMLLPIITAVFYWEKEGFAYVMVAALCFMTGELFSFRKPKEFLFYLKEGCMVTALSWIFMSLFGAVPFVITGEIPNFIDAVFETVSGFTTTGASILTDVEALSHTSLIWRSFTHWIGGMGVLVFLLAIIPLSGGSNINLMRAESPGPSVGKLKPQMRSSAMALYKIYIAITILQIVILLISGMPLFDSLCLSFGTAGTGGFGILNDSIASYTVVQQWIITIFMIMFGVNFNFYYFMSQKQFKKAFEIEEVRVYLCIIAASVVVISINILDQCTGVFDSITKAAFQVGSIITTTGYSTVNFDAWPTLSKAILVLLMFIGACAGSTGGGFKVSRVVILIKTGLKEINSYIHPKSIKKINMDGEPVEHDTIRSVNVYLVTYLLIFITSLLLVSIEGKDLITSFTAVTATYNNIGPGLGLVGPSANYDCMSYFSKIILTIDMLAGRLELFPLIILFHPSLWHDFTCCHKKHLKEEG